MKLGEIDLAELTETIRAQVRAELAETRSVATTFPKITSGECYINIYRADSVSGRLTQSSHESRAKADACAAMFKTKGKFGTKQIRIAMLTVPWFEGQKFSDKLKLDK